MQSITLVIFRTAEKGFLHCKCVGLDTQGFLLLLNYIISGPLFSSLTSRSNSGPLQFITHYHFWFMQGLILVLFIYFYYHYALNFPQSF